MQILMLFTALLLFVCGIVLSIKSRFFQICGFNKVLKSTFGKLIKNRDYKGFKAMTVALGSTIGIGNIVGVSSAICIGGPGSVFWMLLTGVIGMITKYAEVNICLKETRQSNRTEGGPMYVIKRYAPKILKPFGAVFSVAVIMASFFAGNLMQSKSVYEFSNLGFNVGVWPITVVILPLLFIIISGKDRLFQNFSAIFVPLMAVAYILATLIIIFKNLDAVPSAICSIFSSAFGFNDAMGGFSGALISKAIRIGTLKGLFTNEAGLGSSPIAHCSALGTDPFTQGCWGIIEVFIDTVVVCMLTALAVLVSPVYLKGLTNDAFLLICEIFKNTFGEIGLKALSISAVCFAFASIVGWSFYGLKALGFLTKNRVATFIYIVFYIILVPMSSAIDVSDIWFLTDLFNSFMLVPNVVMILFFADESVSELKGKGKR